MASVVVIGAKNEDEQIAVVTAAARAKLPPGTTVQHGNQLDWRALVQEHGGVEGAYHWCARSFDACILVPNTQGMLGKGAYTIAQLFSFAGKQVVMLQGDKFVKVQVHLHDENDWKLSYGRVEVIG